MRYLSRTLMVGWVAILILVTLGAQARLAAAQVTQGDLSGRTTQGNQAGRVRLTATLACLPAGGAEVTFSVRNLGRKSQTIDGDFHLFLDTVGQRGRQFAGAAFVFPIPELAVIRPGEASTFRVPIGDSVEPGEVGTDLRARRLLLEAEVFFEARVQSVRRLFSFPGCAAPAS